MAVSYAFKTPLFSAPPDFHKEITLKERSSRYIRTAFDYYEQMWGKEALDALLAHMGLSRESSIFQHVSDDDNWNSYALEVYFSERLLEGVPDPYESAWGSGVASGSGQLDQNNNLFEFRLKMVPFSVILSRLSEHTSRVSLISETYGEIIKKDRRKRVHIAEIHFNYSRLPDRFTRPHWSTIVVGFGVVYGTVRYRKALPCDLEIICWPNLPSDLPSFHGKHYVHNQERDEVVCAETGEVVGHPSRGPFDLEGVRFNNGTEAIARIQWQPEPLSKVILDMTLYRLKIKREEERKRLKDRVINQLNREHQIQLARYEQELTERARIIREKMEEIRQLKIRQDGDYFLTSLLTRPLIARRNRSPSVSVDFVIRQKKRFQFRGKRSDLGGDLCITDTITLQGRVYAVFLNGDAMGKSMQGAGGALVLGVVFNSLLNRSRSSRYLQSKSPEHWLRDSYEELNTLFVSFEGSMFVTLLMGLVDERTGLLYYLNADHPVPALYREERARFLPPGRGRVDKVGTRQEGSPFRIGLFPFRPGDVFLVGSDGKDDLEIIHRGKGRFLNSDETQFLRRVEEAKGDLKQVVRRLRMKGKFSDDLSLLRITCAETSPPLLPREAPWRDALRQTNLRLRREEVEEARSLLEEQDRNFPRTPAIELVMAEIAIRQNRPEEGASRLERVLERYPAQTGALYWMALAREKQKRFDEALEWTERLHLLRPTHERNLLAMARILEQKGEMREALALLTRHLTQSPANRRPLVELRDRIRREIRTEGNPPFTY